MKKIIFLFPLLAIAGISEAQSKNNQQLEEARKVIIASNATYSDLINKGDGSILTRYTDDACLLPPNSAPVCGKENILDFFKNGPKVHSKFTLLNLYGSGNDIVTEESNYQLYNMSNELIDEGKIIVIWKKTKDGWKMHRDMFSSNRTPKQ